MPVFRCESCGAHVAELRRVRVPGTHIISAWCDDCCAKNELHRCGSCGTRVAAVDCSTEDPDVCLRCWRRGVRRCSVCGKPVECRDDHDRCPQCGNFYDGAIREWDYSPELFFHTSPVERVKKPRGPYLGFELEVDCADVSELKGSPVWLADQVSKDENPAWCKDDGSLRYGFEMVSHPATLQWHKEANWKEKFDFLLLHGMRSEDTGTCGLHVHIDRCFLRELQWQEVSDWFNDHQKFITAISGRSSGYAHFYDDIPPRDINPWGDDGDDVDPREAVINGDYRYAALNFCNDSTIEMRTFIGTLNYYRFLATLEFADAISRRFAEDTEGGVSVEDLTDWVRTDPVRYRELIELFKSKGY